MIFLPTPDSPDFQSQVSCALLIPQGQLIASLWEASVFDIQHPALPTNRHFLIVPRYSLARLLLA